jgi:hypothetical protein
MRLKCFWCKMGFVTEGGVMCGSQDLTIQTLSSVMVTSSCYVVFRLESLHARVRVVIDDPSYLNPLELFV